MERVTQQRYRAKIKAVLVFDNYVYFLATKQGDWMWVSKRTVSRIRQEQGYGIK
ncbi:hypothetical protein [Vibrio alginolyticus]|uniref:hypothetical protein n=1 Tax=Vibrio alginolyticus TaxID=663 RepID=UPI001BD603D7|nr:hypothetical protein [Vibrio alginolyticus]MBS9903215.1 hypothetical protein [Vibrio alginolyticus]